MDSLRDNLPARQLLSTYREIKRRQPEADWHDRVMDLVEVEPSRLHRLHGLLLAQGWLDTRVHLEGFADPRTVLRSYRITPEGMRVLDLLDNPFSPDEEME